MRLALVALVSLGVSSLPVSSAQAPMLGFGVHTCGEYLDLSSENGAEGTDAVFGSWAMGFMSSLNISLMSSSRKMYHDLQSVSPDEQMATVRTYCASHRDDKFWKAILELHNSLATHPYP